ncbi:MAG: hypothetical protein ACQCN5_07855 [Candidatus Bathyarchaeia archaeon]|jgi:hypothetical protein
MGLDWKKWTKNDLIFGVILPTIAIFVIVLISQLPALTEGGFGVVYGITSEIFELVIICAVPLALGLLWNQWAGGATGFLLGTFYALYWHDSYARISGSGLILLAYILSAMLIGYMAGALNKRSDNFKRILVSGLIASTIGGIVLFTILQMSPMNVVDGVDGFLLTVLTRPLVALLTAIVVKVFFWYGMGANMQSKVAEADK